MGSVDMAGSVHGVYVLINIGKSYPMSSEIRVNTPLTFIFCMFNIF